MSDEFPSAKILADSITGEGHRLTSFETTGWRYTLAEDNTHRVLSRNSASSRAIPVAKQIKRIMDRAAVPSIFPREKKGMQGGDALEGDDLKGAEEIWLKAKDKAVEYAQELAGLNVHKSVVNRLMEPFMWHTAVRTATAWENFFEQRCSPLAQPEIRVVAELMREAYEKSEPEPLEPGKWHLPYIDLGEYSLERDDFALIASVSDDDTRYDDVSVLRRDLAKISAARCARTSYMTQDGKRDIAEDLKLFKRLRDARPPHWSPLEHAAIPWAFNVQEGVCTFDGENPIDLRHLPRVGNLVGWCSLRTMEEAIMGEVTFR